MSIARIYVALSSGSDPETVTNVACGISHRFDSQLTGAYIAQSPGPYAYFGDVAAGAGSSAMLAVDTYFRMNDAGEAAARAAWRRICEHHGLSVSETDRMARAFWAGSLPGPLGLGTAARLADLIVVGRPSGNDSDAMATFDAALFQARRSVLVVSSDRDALPLRHVGIAFDGSAEAARAVTCALPLLRHADRISVITVGEPTGNEPTAEDLQDYLAAQGIPTRVAITVTKNGSIARTLLTESHAQGVDLMVMGGYSHSRLRERMLGGVTRDLLENADIPLLMAH